MNEICRWKYLKTLSKNNYGNSILNKQSFDINVQLYFTLFLNMNKILFILLFLSVSSKTVGQTYKDYEKAIENAEKVESLSLVFKDDGSDCIDNRILKLKNLKELSIRFETNREIPEVILKLPSLQYVYLHLGDRSNFPVRIFRIQQLKLLDITSDKLTSIPPGIGQLHQLERLSIHSSKLEALPNDLNKLNSLKYLSISSRYNLVFPDTLDGLCKLEEFNWGEASRFPKEIFEIHSLKKLSFGSPYFQSLPSGFKNLTNLEELSISGGTLHFFPDDICNLKSLRILDLHSTKFETIPLCVSEMPSLLSINLQFNTQFNDFNSLIEILKKTNSIDWVHIDGTQYNEEILNTMKKESVKIDVIHLYE